MDAITRSIYHDVTSKRYLAIILRGKIRIQPWGIEIAMSIIQLCLRLKCEWIDTCASLW